MTETGYKIKGNGVTLYVKKSLYRYGADDVCDIDVDPNVDTITFSNEPGSGSQLNIQLRNVKKQFKNIKKIIIENCIQNIDISNFMFPNVREIDSNNHNYATGSVLMRGRRNSYSLYNTFCLRKDETIDLSDVISINKYALEGCMTNNVINEKELRYLDSHAFYGYCPDEDADKSGVYYFGKSIIRRIDDDANKLDIKNDIRIIHNLVNFSNVKEITVHSMSSLKTVFARSVYQNDVIFDMGKCQDVFAHEFITLFDNQRSLIHSIEITNSERYKTVNGVMYTKDGKSLILCSNKENLEHVDIASGTECICDNAFKNAISLKSVSFPPSIRSIGTDAFAHSGLNGTLDFRNCHELKSISDRAFYNVSDIKNVLFNDELVHIGHYVFFNCIKLKEVELPESVCILGDSSLSNVTNVTIKGTSFVKNIIRAVSHIEQDSLMFEKESLEIVKLENKEHTLYVPKILTSNSINCISSQVDLMQIPEAFKMSMINYATTIEAKQLFNIKLYDVIKNEEIGKYLRRAGSIIVKNLINQNNEEMLVKLLSFDLLTPKAKENALKLAQKHEMATASAYILRSMNTEKKKGKSFVL